MEVDGYRTYVRCAESTGPRNTRAKSNYGKYVDIKPGLQVPRLQTYTQPEEV